MLIKNEFQYAVMLSLNGRRCVIVGGGLVAARKLQALGAAGAKCTVIAPRFCNELFEAAESFKANLIRDTYQSNQLANAFVVIAATDDIAVNRQICADAPCLCNNITEPDLSNFIVPSTIRRGNISVAISTGGMPSFTRLLKRYLLQKLHPAFAEFNDFLRKERSLLQQTATTPRQRTAFWRSVLDEDILILLEAGKTAQAKEKILDAVNSFRSQSQNSSR